MDNHQIPLERTSLQDVYEEVQAFEITLVQDLYKETDYWNIRQAFMTEKNNAFETLKKKIPVTDDKLEIVLTQINAKLTELQTFRDLKIADIEAIAGSELETMKIRFETEADFFHDKTYAATLLLLPNHARALARAKDIEVRSIRKFEKHDDFLSLYYPSTTDTDYIEKVRLFLIQKQEEFELELKKTNPLYAHDDDIDIAEKEWRHIQTELVRKKTFLEQLYQDFDAYKKITQAYLAPQNPLTLHQMIDAVKIGFSERFERHQKDKLIHQNCYREFIQTKGFMNGVKKQMENWELSLHKINNFPKLCKFKVDINLIYLNLKKANAEVSQSLGLDTRQIEQQFAELQIKLNHKINQVRPLNFFEILGKRWSAFPHRQEILLIASAVVAAAICNPAVAGAGIAFAVATIALSLIAFAVMRIMLHTPSPRPAPQ